MRVGRTVEDIVVLSLECRVLASIQAKRKDDIRCSVACSEISNSGLTGEDVRERAS